MAKDKEKKKGKKGAGRTVTNIILVCLIAIALFSAFNLYKIASGYLESRKISKEATKIAGADDFTGDIDFASLQAMNPEVCGWIYLKDTIINYPIVQTIDNETYLTKRVDGTWGGGGTLFADYRTPRAFLDFNTIVYGHHMKDASMFSPLQKFRDESYGKSHSRFELIIPSGKYHLDVVAYMQIPGDHALYNYYGNSEYYKSYYVDMIRQNATYLTGTEFSTADRLVMLSTCSFEYEDARYVVIGKMVPWTDDEINAMSSKKKK
ncbi:MAG: class B sortase [Mogibacterium sp.]|nr:class B sortase [Mogibacterium sp.]